MWFWAKDAQGIGDGGLDIKGSAWGRDYPEIIGGTTINELPWWLRGRESACQCGRLRFDPWVGNIPWRRKWQPTPVLLSGKFRGLKSMGSQRVGHDWVTSLSLFI